MTKDQTAFFDLGLERTLLGTLIMQPDMIPLVDIDIFYKEAHRKIFAKSCEIYQTQKSIPLALLVSHLPEIPAEDISSLLDGHWTKDNKAVEAYVQRLRDLKRKRQIYILSHKMQDALKHDDSQAVDDIAQAIQRERGDMGSKSECEAIRDIIKSFEDNQARKGGIRVGIDSLDRVTDGFCEGEVIYLLGRAKVAKSSLAQNFLRYFVIHYPQFGAVFFSFEMPSPQLGERLLGIELDKSMRSIAATALEKEQVISRYKNVFYITVPTMSLHDIYATIIKLKYKSDVRLVVIDFLTRIKTNIPGEYDFIRGATKALKDFAKELNVVLIVLAQVGREMGGGGWMPLGLQSGRGSGTIEEDGDFILGIYRPELNKDMKDEDRDRWRDVVVLQVLGSRRTEIPNDIYLNFNKHSLRMNELAARPPRLPEHKVRET